MTITRWLCDRAGVGVLPPWVGEVVAVRGRGATAQGDLVAAVFLQVKASTQTGADRALCRNVALTADNRDAWQEHLTTVGSTLTTGEALAPYVRERLGQRREQIDDLLEPAALPQDT